MKYYRFKNGQFIKANSFEDAKSLLIEKIMTETEDANRWHKCTCLGFQHRAGCPEAALEDISF